jgi:tetratricopeptide (TPR) repeat protein
MATVYLAEDVKHRRKVALKVLRPELSTTLGRDRFLREIDIAARLRHPHILPLYDSGEAAGFLYFVMPYEEGQSLREKVLEEGELSISETVRLLRDVVDALAHAHAQGVVHRDIKPENVLLSGQHAIVTDFGVANAVHAAVESERLTIAGMALGTPAYMAPEQAAGDTNTDPRADLYAVGVVAYELLTGRTPFHGSTARRVLAAHITEAPAPVTEYRAAVPPLLAQVVMKCLEKEPTDRWQSAEELLSQLDAVAITPTGVTPATTGAELLEKYETQVRRAHPLRVAVLFVLASIGTLVIVDQLIQLLGLPSWVFPCAVALLAIGLPIMLFTGRQQRLRVKARGIGEQKTAPKGLRRHFTWGRSLAGGLLAFLGLAVASAGFMAMRELGIGPAATLLSAGILDDRERIVLASFENTTSDSTLGETVTELFRIDLAQSPAVTIMAPSQMAAVLVLMERSPTEPVDGQLAVELAEREGLRGVVTGEIRPLGSALVLSARLIGVSSGDVLWSGQERVASPDELFGALDRLSAALRERVGESLRTIRRDAPLERATTRSTDALRLYTSGLRANEMGDPERAIALLERAIATDSTFAMAYRKLGVVLNNFGRDPQRADTAFAKAYRLRDRLTERERYLAEGAYHRYVTGDNLAAIAAYEAVLEKYPDEPAALNNLAVRYQVLGRLNEAAQLLLHSISLGHASPETHTNTVEVLYSLGAVDSAAHILESFVQDHPRNPRMMQLQSEFASARGDYEAAEDHAIELRNVHRGNRTWEMRSSLIMASLAKVRGRLSDAHRYLDEALDKAWELSLPFTSEVPRSVLQAVERADYQLRFRNDAPAARAILDSVPGGDWPVSSSFANPDYLSLAEVYARLGDVRRARGLLQRLETSLDADDLARSENRRMHAQGVIALAERRFEDAISTLRRWADHESNSNSQLLALFDLAQAYDAAGDADSAIAYYNRYLTEQWLYRLESDAGNLWIVLRRLGALHEARGDSDKALKYYDRLLVLWKDADPELQPMALDLRNRIAMLVREPGGRS